MKQYDVSIIIVSWNTCDVLKNCLNSILRETQSHSYQIIVIDNDSKDGTQAMIRSNFPQIHLIENRENRGFAAANNQGLRVAQGRYCLLLNPDTLVLDGAIDKIIEYADHHPEYAVVGCQVMEDENKVQQTCCQFHSALNTLIWLSGLSYLFPESRVFGRERMGWWKRDTEKEVDVVSGMFMLVRREAIEQVGLLDEDYFIYAEEVDWCFRFWKAGWKCVFAPVARILHLDGGGKSTSQVSVRMYVQQQKSILIFKRKNLGFFSWAISKWIYILAMLQRALLWKLLSILKIGKSSSHQAEQALAALRFHLFGMEPEK